MKKSLISIGLMTIVFAMPVDLFASSEYFETGKNYNNDVTDWNFDKNEEYLKGDVVYFDGKKYIVNDDYIASGNVEEIQNSTIFSPIAEVGETTLDNETTFNPYLETCIGDNWRTVAKDQIKTDIINRGFSDIWRKTSFYSLSASKNYSQSVTLSGYGVAISYASALEGSGGWGDHEVDKTQFSKMRTNVKGYVQRKQLSNCSTVNRFVKTHEWITISYE